jgi:hypothetical protein
MEDFAAVRVPYFAEKQSACSSTASAQHRTHQTGNVVILDGKRCMLGGRLNTYAVKSALPVTARAVSKDSLELQTAPLWPVDHRQYNMNRSISTSLLAM